MLMSETNTKYLYGASVQGIQGFIFQTNKLKEIVGASEIVEQICTTEFGKILGKTEKELQDPEMISTDKNWIVGAAGNIKYIFETASACAPVVKDFPKQIMTMAPGITISQAVVKLGNNFKEAVEKLEANLKTQRNRAILSRPTGLMAMARSRATGLPGCKYEKNELIDEGTDRKRREAENSKYKLPAKSFGNEIDFSEENLPLDIEKMVEANNWIAVIHADGNGVGRIIEKIGHNHEELKVFSKNLDLATTEAAREAYGAVKERFDEKKLIPIRPVVLSGDDLTLICRADLAVPYVNAFLQAFETKTQEILKSKLTACAGIAFVKVSYPFHYAVKLSGSLCDRAKDDAKLINRDLAPSCFMFHKVQDSFVEDFGRIVKRELSPGNLSFVTGPYYLNIQPDKLTIDKILSDKESLQQEESSGVKSHLRQWLELLFSDVEAANQKMKRLISITPQSLSKDLKLRDYSALSKESKQRIPFYDLLSLISIETPKKQEDEK